MCFGKLGWANQNQVLAVRDLWSHMNIGTTTVGKGYVAAVPEEGASVLLKFTPQ